jgi:hypothetical protein
MIAISVYSISSPCYHIAIIDHLVLAMNLGFRGTVSTLGMIDTGTVSFSG